MSSLFELPSGDLGLLKSVVHRNPISIFPDHWTPETIQKHAIAHAMGVYETQVWIVNHDEPEEISEGLADYFAKPSFYEMVAELDRGQLRDKKKGDWSAAAHLQVVMPNASLSICINRTTIEGMRVAEYFIDCQGYDD
ncbi:hypothetical protein ACFCQI_02965 [Rhodanobacter sp. FW102-FHT14D06]|uniref:Uncharacterized protein n=2 Tax=unclassified Rhodanobacter TaxID=2621553 RepID=A0AB74URL1_9GAMM